MKERSSGKARRPFKIWKLLLRLVAAIIVFAAAAFLALTLTEYKPDPIEVTHNHPAEDAPKLAPGASLTVVTYNTGYAALGEDADFFMDGGKTTRPDSRETVSRNIEGVSGELGSYGADIMLLQEVDKDSKRSYYVDEAEEYAAALHGMAASFALNYSSAYVPFPIPSTLGRVQSGLMTFLKYPSVSSERVQLPVPFSWPVRCFNLKRCMLIDRIPLEGTDKELVIINMHLEAYDSGEGRIAQAKQLFEQLEKERELGNYVIVGGDFNHTFPGVKEYPAVKEGNWMPNVVDEALPEGFSFAVDPEKPTCRLLDVPYKGNPEPQYYIIDGFIVSSNITVESVEVIETGFVYADHQPVKLNITLN